MYKIIGSDQVEYGPVTADQVGEWIAQGRINAQTRMQAEGSPDWKAVQDFPEFAAALGRLTAAPPASGPPPLRVTEAGPVKTSRMAIWSLVLGILSIVSCGVTLLITAPVGLILGLVSMSKIRKSQGRLTGRGIALAGTIVSGIAIVLLPVLAGLLLPALAQAKNKAQGIMCMNNMKQLVLAARIYASDHKDRLPEAADWCDALVEQAGNENVFKCPAGHDGQRSHYAMNDKLSGAVVDKVAPDTVLFFESDGGWNATGNRDILLQNPRHRRTFTVGFTDGHVEMVTKARAQSLRWEP
jgi:prepilin-type processing-associated H-X9-DG protein